MAIVPAKRSDQAQEAFLAIVSVAQRLMREVSEVVRAEGLTEPQFNALRILRGAGPEGLPCSTIAERMITRVPDITRLTDRLERMGLAQRRRDMVTDRRVVHVAITRRGSDILRTLDAPVKELHGRQFERLSQTRISELLRTIEKVGMVE